MRTVPMTRLSDVTSVITKGTTPTSIGYQFTNKGIGFLRVQNIENGGISLDADLLYIDKETDGALARSRILPNDVLLSIAGTIGRAAVVPENAPQLNCNQALAIIRPTQSVDPHFLRFWLESEQARDQIVGATVTGTISNLSLGQISNLQFPLFPLMTQKMIVDRLKAVEKISQLRKAAISDLSAYTNALFIEMFGEPSLNPLKLPILRLDQVTEIGSGITKGKKYGDKKLTEVPYIRVANVQAGYLDLKEIKTIEVAEGEIERYLLKPGDVLMTEGGDWDKLGRGAVWDGSISPCIHQNHIFRVRPDNNKILPFYLDALLQTSYAKTFFQRASKQTTNLATINKTQLSAFPIPLPPTDVQSKFCDAKNAVAKLVTKMEASATEIDSLMQSVLAESFSEVKNV